MIGLRTTTTLARKSRLVGSQTSASKRGTLIPPHAAQSTSLPSKERTIADSGTPTTSNIPETQMFGVGPSKSKRTVVRLNKTKISCRKMWARLTRATVVTATAHPALLRSGAGLSRPLSITTSRTMTHAVPRSAPRSTQARRTNPPLVATCTTQSRSKVRPIAAPSVVRDNMGRRPSKVTKFAA